VETVEDGATERKPQTLPDGFWKQLETDFRRDGARPCGDDAQECQQIRTFEPLSRTLDRFPKPRIQVQFLVGVPLQIQRVTE